MQRSEIELLSYTTHKIDVKWVKDLNLRLDSIKLLRENMGNSSLALVWAMIFFFFFLAMTSKAQAKILHVELHQTKKLLHRK